MTASLVISESEDRLICGLLERMATASREDLEFWVNDGDGRTAIAKLASTELAHRDRREYGVRL